MERSSEEDAINGPDYRTPIGGRRCQREQFHSSKRLAYLFRSEPSWARGPLEGGVRPTLGFDQANLEGVSSLLWSRALTHLTTAHAVTQVWRNESSTQRVYELHLTL
jgi:hypothetical protein